MLVIDRGIGQDLAEKLTIERIRSLTAVQVVFIVSAVMTVPDTNHHRNIFWLWLSWRPEKEMVKKRVKHQLTREL